MVTTPSDSIFKYTNLVKVISILQQIRTEQCSVDTNKNRVESGVVISSAEFNLLLGYFVTDQRYHSIYNYKYSILYSFIFKYIVFIGLFTKHIFFYMYMFSCQCNVTFFQQTRYKKSSLN